MFLHHFLDHGITGLAGRRKSIGVGLLLLMWELVGSSRSTGISAVLPLNVPFFPSQLPAVAISPRCISGAASFKRARNTFYCPLRMVKNLRFKRPSHLCSAHANMTSYVRLRHFSHAFRGASYRRRLVSLFVGLLGTKTRMAS